ncbi:MAG: putative ABC transporter ATP-binding protein [Brockia lithotrophica]|uniref:Putative ABC transporter ATP-binding protein n=1 Tax=Brockia lithotrophica TaxID=933949 RepID=A0A2T5GAY1_9BACL|nr:ATP-binding cassette domain-containing protein [Brockia lithotrophica]PTQ53341.1 MAG: putative ABC transporter ATP-binding protein [Brockia lithotrophica]
MLELKHVGVSRRGRTLLADINWLVERGSAWAVLGPNGAGKTTLLEVIGGELHPSSGTVVWEGTPLFRIPLAERRRKIAWVSSALGSRLYPGDSPVEIVAGALFAATTLYGRVPEKAARQAEEALAGVGLASRLHVPYGELSLGEQKKVLLARALVRAPELLVLDEATEGLDFAAREAFLAALRDLRSAHPSLAIVFVTHRLEELGAIFDSVLLLGNGRIRAQGPRGDVLREEVLADLFGAPLELRWWNDRPYAVPRA